MNTPKISVIVPIYNVEKYLPQCLESILSQTFTDYELLLIDDGSKDRSGEICDRYAERDSRVKVFHTENRGVSAARNLGLEKATAEWICFVDSDDWVEDRYLQSLFNGRCLSKESIVCQSFYVENELYLETRRKLRSYSDIVLREPFDESLVMYYLLNNYSVNVFAKLFSRKLIVDHQIFFCEDISWFEDAIFLHNYLLYVKEIALSSFVSYHYMQRNSNISLTKKVHTCEDWLAIAKELLKTTELLIKNLSIHGTEHVKATYTRYGLSQLYSAFICVDKNNYKEIYRYLWNKKPLFKKYYMPSTIEQKLFLRYFFIEVIPPWFFYYSSVLLKFLLK